MKKAVAFANIAGVFVPMALGVLGGCVNLEKPSSVAACSSGKEDPCFDGEKNDAGRGNKDLAVSDAVADHPSTDTRLVEDAVLTPEVADAATSDAGPPAVADADPNTPGFEPIDALPPDTRPAAYDTSLSPDLVGPEVPQVTLDGQPGLPNSADVGFADSVPDLGADLGPDSAPDLPSLDGPPATTTTITFKAGRATAAGMNGYGWVTLGSADSVSSPKCGAASTPITAAAPCAADIVWDSTTVLCVTGTVPALSAAATDDEYVANWGIEVGTNLREPLAAAGLAFKTVAVNVTGLPSTGLRLELHRSGDPSGTTYCALLTSGSPIPITKFNTQCWNDLGDALTEADAVKIDKIGVQVSSGSTEIAVTKLCLESIVLGS